MSAHCNDKQYDFLSTGRRAVTGKFDDEQISSDGGATLLREVDRRIGLTARLAACVTDHREPGKVQHTAESLLSQRLYGICLAYEDLNDHEHLRHDQMLGLMLEQVDEMCDPAEPKALASPSTLNRMEMGDPELAADHRYKRIVVDEAAVDELMLSVFVESFETPPEELWLDLGATDDPVHGAQEGGYFHGYYDCRCYLPLYIFCGEHLLCSRLRTADKDGADGSVAELERIIGRLRQHWPEVQPTIYTQIELDKTETKVYAMFHVSDTVHTSHTETAGELTTADIGVGPRAVQQPFCGGPSGVPGVWVC